MSVSERARWPSILRVGGALLLLPLRALAAVGRAARRLFRSARFWVLLILLIIGLLVTYYIQADRYTPLTTDAYAQAYVVGIAPQVEGQVVAVHVRENDRVAKDQLLFEIDPRPFEHEIARLEAKLAEVTQQVAQLDSALEAARAEHARVEAEEAYARAVYGQENRIFERQSTTERKYLDAQQKYKAATAALDRSAKLVQSAEQALAARIGAEHALVAEVKAELATARLDLTYTKVTAPTDGYVTDLQLRVGAYAHVGQAMMTLIDDRQWLVVANFRENCLALMREGQPALVSFRTYPGRLFRGQVSYVGWGVGQGQGVPSGRLPEVPNLPMWVPVPQRFQVRLSLDAADAPPTLRVGMTGTVSVYIGPGDTLGPLTRALHKFLSWLSFVY